MTAKQIALAVKIAQAGVVADMADADKFLGIATRDVSGPVCATVEEVAGLLRYQCLQFNGGWDHQEQADLTPHLRRKVVCA